MANKVQLIKQEIERLHELLPVMDGDNVSINYAERFCIALEKYIDSLPESGCEVNCTTKNEDLEEEITKCYKSRNDLMMTRKQFGELIHHFAEWQKQQMMKDAIEGWCINGGPILNDIRTLETEKDNLKVGDKVKIIIVKEEQ